MKNRASLNIYIITLSYSAIVAATIIYLVLNGARPCPMCILQQISLAAIVIISLIALFNKQKVLFNRIYSFMIGISSLAGALVAIRQVWLEYSPNRAASCHVAANALLSHLPQVDFVNDYLLKAPDCATDIWKLFGLSMPTYSIIFFVVTGILHFNHFLRYGHNNNN